MKVKIRDKIYNPDEEPIMIILDQEDKELISSMDSNSFMYCCFPKDTTMESAEEFMRILPFGMRETKLEIVEDQI